MYNTYIYVKTYVDVGNKRDREIESYRDVGIHTFFVMT